MSGPAGLLFLSWARQGIGAGAGDADPLTGSLDARRSLQIGVHLHEREEKTFDARLYGPGDVTGIDPRQVIRMEPASGASDFEPNMLACVELDRPDLPWLLTPAAADDHERLRPWIVLIVVEAAHSTLERPGAGLPVLTCRASELPSLDDSWAWAHAQVAVEGSPTDVEALLASDPERNLSRLLSPRRLAAGTRYLAAVVPAFEPGRKAGLGLELDDIDRESLRVAWTAGGEGNVVLPAYHWWEFTTGAEGDFEALVRRLVARVMPPTLGLREMDASRPGAGLLGAARVLGLEGALRGPATLPTEWPAAERAAFEAALEPRLRRPSDRVAPPRYGSIQAPATTWPRWLRELNLDPRHRAAAAFGTRVVQEHQEALMESAWRQAAELNEANAILRHGQLARSAAQALFRRRIARAGADERLIELSANAHAEITAPPNLAGVRPAVVAAAAAARAAAPPDDAAARGATAVVEAAASGATAAVEAAARVTGGAASADAAVGDAAVRTAAAATGGADAAARGAAVSDATLTAAAAAAGLAPPPVAATEDVSVADVLASNREALAVAGAAFRRAARPRGPLARRLGERVMPPVAALALRDLQVNPTLENPAGMVSLRKFSSDAVRDLRPERIIRRWWQNAPSGPVELPVPATPGIWWVGAAMPNRVWAVADGRMYSCVTESSGFGWIDHGQPPGTWAASPPAAIRDLNVVVRGGDGTLRGLYWDGDRWAWVDYGRPGGSNVAGAPAGVWRSSRPNPGGFPTQGKDYRSAFVVTQDGRLFELFNGNWADRGNPGVALTGTPGITDDWQVAVTGADGRLFEHIFDGAYRWADYGKPSNAMLSGVYSAPAPFPGLRFALGSAAGTLFAGVVGPYKYWVPQITPEPAGAILGTGTDGALWVAGNRGGRLFRIVSGGNGWEAFGPPPGLDATNLALTGGLRGSNPVVHAQGKLLELAGGQWRDYGVPRPGGIGTATAPPPAHRRWRPPHGVMSNLVVAHADAPAGDNRVYTRVGRNIDFDGTVREGWALKPATQAPAGDSTQGLGIAIADISGNGRPDLLVFWVQDLGLGNYGCWQIGWNLNAAGDPSSWSDVKVMPTPMITYIGSGGALTRNWLVTGADVAIGDLDGDLRPELIIAYATGEPTPRSFYRVGWGLDANGNVTGGWTESQDVPAPAGPVQELGVAVVDLDGDFKPEIVVLSLEQSRAVYHIGKNINARGFVTGGWTTKPVGGPAFPANIAGAGLAVADFSGSERADLVVFHIEDTPTENLGYYRIGWDVAPNGDARSWSGLNAVHPGGWFGTVTQGGGIAVSDIDPALIVKKLQFADAFQKAAGAHQAQLVRARELAAADDAAIVQVSDVATSLRSGLQPERTVTARVAAKLDGVDEAQLRGLTDPLAPFVAAPAFTQPMYKPLAELSQDLLLPGVASVPRDTTTLLRANTPFIEAYLLGLNHEMARELLWREFPTDRSATFFNQFWDSPSADIPAIGAWNANAPLGGSTTGAGGPDTLLLLVRGEVLRRYPGAAVYARRAEWDAPGAPRRLGTATIQPQFGGTLPPDLVFFGFPLTVDAARGDTKDAGWFFVIQQQPTGPRFGVDERPDGVAYGGAPSNWRDLHEGQLATSEQGLEALVHLPLAPPFGTGDRLLRARRAGETADPPKFAWARNSAHMAQILFQPPVQLAVHATDMLPGIPAAWPVTHVSLRPQERPELRIAEIGGQDAEGRWWRHTAGRVIAAIKRGDRFAVGAAALQVATTDGIEHLAPLAPLLALPELPDA